MVTGRSALEAFEKVLGQLAAEGREPTAWEETNYLEVVTAIVAGDHQTVMDRIADSQRSPTPAEIAAIKRRQLQAKEELRQNVEEARGARMLVRRPHA